MTTADFARLAQAGEAMFQQLALDSYSPGGAAAVLGVSRQRVHQLIEQGELLALRLIHSGSGDLAAIVISSTSLREYQRRQGNPPAPKAA
jgi:hypothetical protein